MFFLGKHGDVSQLREILVVDTSAYGAHSKCAIGDDQAAHVSGFGHQQRATKMASTHKGSVFSHIYATCHQYFVQFTRVSSASNLQMLVLVGLLSALALASVGSIPIQSAETEVYKEFDVPQLR